VDRVFALRTVVAPAIRARRCDALAGPAGPSAARGGGRQSGSGGAACSLVLVLVTGIAVGVVVAGDGQPRAPVPAPLPGVRQTPIPPAAVLEVQGSGPGRLDAVLGLVVSVPATVNDTAVECLVDTGADTTIISQTAAEGGSLGRPLNMLRLQSLSGAPFEGAVHRVPVRTEALSWPEARVVVVPDAALAGWSCILGVNLLSQQPITIDWEERSVRPRAAPAPAPPPSSLLESVMHFGP
jgi:gag-polyprotein putative aspartyl protease